MSAVKVAKVVKAAAMAATVAALRAHPGAALRARVRCAVVLVVWCCARQCGGLGQPLSCEARYLGSLLVRGLEALAVRGISSREPFRRFASSKDA